LPTSLPQPECREISLLQSPTQHYNPPHDDTRENVEFIPGPEQHITEAFLNAKFSDEESIRIRGELRSIEILILQEIKPQFSMEKVLGMLSSFRNELLRKIIPVGANRDEHQAIVPHASKPTTSTSYITVPLQVAKACNEAMKRNGISIQDKGPQAKRKD